VRRTEEITQRTIGSGERSSDWEIEATETAYRDRDRENRRKRERDKNRREKRTHADSPEISRMRVVEKDELTPQAGEGPAKCDPD
jgi:hypothetical protein